ncbi:single-stranded-DNA-specific exonuclease RecJ [Candidatus Berkelbacteria bacterium]|nr:single-stranded-DNA-specific exonuclease RecJ [Candidatus Berkelbacteria bacterium]
MESNWSAYKRSDDDLLTHLLKVRKIETEWLDPSYDKHLHDPFLLPDMEKACKLVAKLKLGDKIAVFGDYDADGTPAAALLYELLTQLGFLVQVLLPTRQEGYGLNSQTIKKIDSGTKLLITVDTGITANQEINEFKMPVIIIDHHLPKETLPKAGAIIDPFLKNSKYPYKYLCACALAYKFALALTKYFPNKISSDQTKWFLDLVAISTVSDMVPITGENRVLVYYGLIVLKKNRRVGLKALMEVSGVDVASIDAERLGYVIGPRINASGRISDNRPAFELLITKDPITANKLAIELNNNNIERQKLVLNVQNEAETELFIKNNPEDKLFILFGKNWPGGVLGLVAGKIAQKYNRPVIIGSVSNGNVTASARSISNFSIAEALQFASVHLSRFGGHDQAAGLTLNEKNAAKFVDNIKHYAETKLKSADLQKTYVADSLITINEIKFDLINSLDRIAPFGYQNPKPLFILKDINLGSARKMGANENHFKWQIENDIDVLGFSFAQKKIPTSSAHLLGNIEKNTWNGNTKLQINLVDILPASALIKELDV